MRHLFMFQDGFETLQAKKELGEAMLSLKEVDNQYYILANYLKRAQIHIIGASKQIKTPEIQEELDEARKYIGSVTEYVHDALARRDQGEIADVYGVHYLRATRLLTIVELIDLANRNDPADTSSFEYAIEMFRQSCKLASKEQVEKYIKGFDKSVEDHVAKIGFKKIKGMFDELFMGLLSSYGKQAGNFSMRSDNKGKTTGRGSCRLGGGTTNQIRRPWSTSFRG